MDEQSITVGIQQLEARILAHENVKCFGGNTGWASANGYGGRTPYTFFWATGGVGQADSLAQNLSAGAYSVTVTDANNCPATATVTVLEPEALSIELLSTHVKCFGESSGAVVARPSGGIAPYQFLWQNGQTTQEATAIPAGRFNITLTDQNGLYSPTLSLSCNRIPALADLRKSATQMPRRQGWRNKH